MTLKEALQDNLAALRRRCSPTSWHPYESHARHFTELWGEREMESIRPAEVEEWANLRRETVRDGTIRHQLAFLKGTYRHAIDEGKAQINPVAKARIRLRHYRRSRWMTHDEEVKLARQFRLRPGGELEWSAVRFAVLTGVRRGEQLQLRPEHIRNGELHIEKGKTGPRIIPIHPKAEEIAKAWTTLARARGSKWLFWPDKTADRFRFGLWHYWNVWVPTVRKAGVEDLHWRDLRRTFGCRLIELEVPVFEVQKLLGHSNPMQTMTYCQVQVGQLRQSVNKLV